jgi:hypothetical protein
VASPNDNPDLPPWIADLPIEALDLSVRSYNALRRKGIRTLGELSRLSDGQLLRLYAFGRKSLGNVRQALAEFFARTDIRKSLAEFRPGTDNLRTSGESLRSGEGQSRLSAGGWVVPPIWSGDPDVPIEALDLSTRSGNVVSHLGIKTVRQLLDYSKRKLFQAESFGRKSMAEIETKLLGYLLGELRADVGLKTGNSLQHESPQLSGTKTFVDQMLSYLPERQRNLIADRYGLWDGIAETLQDIGDKLGVTRERIRQIEAAGLKRLRWFYRHRAARDFVKRKIGSYLEARPEARCGILNEDEAVGALADDCSPEEAAVARSFFQDVDAPGGDLFTRHLVEAEPGVYCVDKRTAAEYDVLLELVELALQRNQKAMSEQKLYGDLAVHSGRPLTPREIALLGRLFEVSPSVMRLRNGTIARSSWKEFGRRDAISLAGATLRLLGRPAHFREIAEKASVLFRDVGPVNERTIHNALICNQEKFVWVKSGTYGLAAWGLKKPPFIKDRLVELLGESRYPLPLWHLKEKVLEVCNCKEESIRMTLDLNPKLFKKFEGDQYGLRKHYGDAAGEDGGTG